MVYSWESLGKFSGVSLRSDKVFGLRGKILTIYDLSKSGEQRLKWLDFYNANQKNARLTCRHFGVSPKTFYKAKNRYEHESYRGLNDRSRKPRNFRKSKIPLAVITAIVCLRKQYPTWSKYKLGACLRRQGMKLSASSVGRVLKTKGLINCHTTEKKQRIYKRSLKRLRIDGETFFLKQPGDLVQLDTKHYRHLWGQTVYQFTAIDCVTKLRVLRVYSSKTAQTGKQFLQEVIRFLPFKIKRVQSDNGSEFLGGFRRECLDKKIIHVFSYPRSPEQNAFVEASHSTDEREFYAVKEMPADLPGFSCLLKDWEKCYNFVRPHQSLNYLTPWEYFQNLCSAN